MTEAEMRRLVDGFWSRVDGGWCLPCTTEAVEACKAAWPDLPWDRVLAEVIAAAGL